MTTPVRLLDDPETSADLQADLTAWQQHEVPFELEASLAQFQARIESGAWEADLDPGPAEPVEPSGVIPKGSTEGATTSGAGSVGAGKLGAGKLLGVLVVGAGVGIGALQLARTDASTEAPSASVVDARDTDDLGAASEPESRDETQPSVADDARAEEPADGDMAAPTEAAPPARPTPRRPQASPTKQEPASSRADVVGANAVPTDQVDGAQLEQDAAPAEIAPQQPPSDALQRELAQLGEVRRALTQDPRRALELANRGHAEFQGGSLYQEREALALRALHALGARDALESRGRAFLLRYPKSSFAREVERMLTK